MSTTTIDFTSHIVSSACLMSHATYSSAITTSAGCNFPSVVHSMASAVPDAEHRCLA